MSTLEALKTFVGESVIIKTGTLDCSYCQFTGDGDIHIFNINNPSHCCQPRQSRSLSMI